MGRPVGPSEFIPSRYLSEGRVEGGGFGVVGGEGLLPVGTEGVFVQRVHLDWGSEVVAAAEIYDGDGEV